MVVSERRPHNVNTRMTDEEHAMLRALADRSGLNGSDVVRQLIRTAYAEQLGDKKSKRRRPKK